MSGSTDVAQYIASAPPAARSLLKQLRATIRKAIPGLTERISYRIPTFDLNGKRCLYIAAFRDHVSIYPVTRAINSEHSRAIAKYRSGAGTLRFELGEALPLALVARIAKTRAREMSPTLPRARSSAKRAGSAARRA